MTDPVPAWPAAVGFVGLGSQGAPMAARLIEVGFPTTLFARRPESLEPFAGSGARVATSCAELAAASDVVGVCVVDDADVDEVTRGRSGLLEGARPGTVIAVHSTVHPDTCRRLAADAAALGVGVVDAPVSGGGLAAAAGRLLVMVGADPATFDRCRPVFAAYGDPVCRMGAVGAGQLAKLVNNALMLANLALADDAVTLGDALGLDPGALAAALAHGSGASFALGLYPGRHGLPQGLLAKDVGLLAQAAAAVPGDPPLVAGAQRGLSLAGVRD